ncbi:MAG: amidohydrolase family protein [Anaerolineae bacterium]|nr:amidohydrolase family protein [Anaerolineae bacterium]
MPRDVVLEGEIRQALDQVRMIDTHEHLDTEEEFIGQPVDFGRLFLHYANCDLISAGCPPADIERLQLDPDMGPQSKWALIAPYWGYVRDTGYGRCLELAIRDLYGLDGLSADTVEPLSERMAANRRPGFYREVYDKAGIAVALWNRLDRLGPIPHMWTLDYDRSLFVQDVLGGCMNLGEPEWQTGWGREILCLDDYLGAIEERFGGHARQASALKIGLAYERPLLFPNRTRAEIEPLFNRALNGGWSRNIDLPTQSEICAIQDYLMHFCLQQCNKYDLTVKFHTGLQEGNGNIIGNSRAALLSNLFVKYPKVRFDIYHISYPYQEELATLAKNFPNVAIDFCWMWIINPAAARRALSDFLDAVPANKIHGFGGDFIFIEGTYAHALMAKEGIARTLAGKVMDGDLSVERAIEIGRWLLRDNPIHWFGLRDKVAPDVLGAD